MKNGFIMEKAQERYKDVRLGTLGLIAWTTTVCLPFILIELPMGDYTTVALWGVLTLVFLALGMINRHKARKILDRITDIARHMGKQEYYRACDDLSRGEEMGGIFCGEEYLFSPSGLLCRWVETGAVQVIFHNTFTRSGLYAYDRITVKVSPADGSAEMTRIELTESEDIRLFSEKADRFSELVREHCGITVGKSFE